MMCDGDKWIFIKCSVIPIKHNARKMYIVYCIVTFVYEENLRSYQHNVISVQEIIYCKQNEEEILF